MSRGQKGPQVLMEEAGLWSEAEQGGGSHTKYVSLSSRGKHQQSFNLE